MGKLSWSILLENTGTAPCSLQGWPGLRIQGPDGKQITVSTRNVSFSNLGSVPVQRVTIAPGQSSAVTVQTSDNTSGCQEPWTLMVTLPGVTEPVTARQGADGFGPCGGSRTQLLLSPFYPETALTAAVNALDAPDPHSVFPHATASEPAACKASDLRVSETSAWSSTKGSVTMLRLINRGADTCALPGSTLAVRLNETGGSGQVAKALPGPVPSGVTRRLPVTYGKTGSLRTALPIQPGTASSVALVTTDTGAACRMAGSATVYPALSDVGAGVTVPLARPITMCGLPRVLPVLSGQPTASTLNAAIGQAAASIGATGIQAPTAPETDTPAGFVYGSDSSAPIPTQQASNGEWLMPDDPSSDFYGGYMGEIGSYQNDFGSCGTGLNWSNDAASRGNANFMNFGYGIGTGGYYMLSGPGRESGGYSSSSLNARLWGLLQAVTAVQEASNASTSLLSEVIVADVEAAGQHGWSEGWSGPCSSTVTANSIPPALNYGTLSEFLYYIYNYTPYFVEVYNAGDGGSDAWTSIFGSQTLPDTMEWTFESETPSLSTFPSGFSVPGATALWFASAPTACQFMWQWSGGGGVLNGIGDFDQIDADLLNHCQ